MSYRTVASAQKTVWPAVKKSLRLHRLSRQAVACGAEVSAKARQNADRSWDRIVMEETIWATAKADLLASPEHAALVQAARNWAKTWKSTPPSVADHDDDPADVALYKAIQDLATSPSDFPVEETLTPVEAPRTVTSTTKN